MMYSEFIEGTGCKDNEKNYQVYKELEIIYMNSDCTKEHIYDMGKKLVDNSKTEEQLKFEAEMKDEIERHKEEIEKIKKEIEWKKQLLEWAKEDGDKEQIKFARRVIKSYQDDIKYCRNKIKEIKWILA